MRHAEIAYAGEGSLIDDLTSQIQALAAQEARADGPLQRRAVGGDPEALDPRRGAHLMPIPATSRLVEFPVMGKGERLQRSAGFFRGRRFANESALPRPPSSADARRALRPVARKSARSSTEAQAAFEQRLAEERAAWAAQEGARLAERMQTAFAALESGIGEAVAGYSQSFRRGMRFGRNPSTHWLRRSHRFLPPGRTRLFRYAGRQDLLDSLRETLGTAASALTFEVSDDLDVRLVADRTLIETQLEVVVVADQPPKRVVGHGRAGIPGPHHH